MSKGCQARIRGYLSKARSQLFGAKLDTILNDASIHSEIISKTETLCSYGGQKSSTILKRKLRASPIKSCTPSSTYSENGDGDEFGEEYWDEIDAIRINQYRGTSSDKFVI